MFNHKFVGKLGVASSAESMLNFLYIAIRDWLIQVCLLYYALSCFDCRI